MDPDRLARRIMDAGFVGPDDLGAKRDAPADLQARYEVLERIGSGGCGEVFRARDRHMDRVVALKRIPLPEGAQRRAAELRERLRREAQTLARLRHEGIPLVYDTSATDDALFIVMELVDGESLEAALDGRRLAPAEGARVVEQAARIAHFAHTQGFVHRDLKPANILRGRDGRVHLVDFGVVKATESATLTATGMIVGTPAYTSPEQIEGRSREADARSDVFSLGAVLYHALTGRPPFDGESLIALAVAIREREPDPPSAIAPDVPLPLERIALRALAKAPADRYPTALALAEALAGWRRGKAHDATVALPVPAARGPWWRTPALAAMAGGAVLVLAVAVTIAGRGAPQHQEATASGEGPAAAVTPPAPSMPERAPSTPTERTAPSSPATERTPTEHAPSAQRPSPAPSTPMERTTPPSQATGGLVERALAEWDREAVLWPGVRPRLTARLAALCQELAYVEDPTAAWVAEALALPGGAELTSLQERLAPLQERLVPLQAADLQAADLWRIVGDLLVLDDRPDRAVEAYDRALQFSASHASSLSGKAVALVCLGSSDASARARAGEAALAAMRLAPSNPHCLLAAHMVRLGPRVGLLRRLTPGALTGRFEELRVHVLVAERAAAGAPADPTCSLVLAEACLVCAVAAVDAGLPFDAAQVARAVQLASGVPAEAPGRAEALWVLAEASYMLARRGDRSQGARTEDALRGLLELAPEHAPAHLALGGLLSARGLVEEGQRERARAQALDPSLTGPR